MIGGNPTFKEMLKFVYGVWNFVATPQVYLHDNGYFIFKSESIEDRDELLQYGPYTFNNKSMILKQWIPDFCKNHEQMNSLLLWVTFPALPLHFWATENLSRIASSLGKPICTDRLTAKGE